MPSSVWRPIAALTLPGLPGGLDWHMQAANQSDRRCRSISPRSMDVLRSVRPRQALLTRSTWEADIGLAALLLEGQAEEVHVLVCTTAACMAMRTRGANICAAVAGRPVTFGPNEASPRCARWKRPGMDDLRALILQAGISVRQEHVKPRGFLAGGDACCPSCGDKAQRDTIGLRAEGNPSVDQQFCG